MTRYVIGNVISVEGLKIDILMNNQSNLEAFHYDGTIYDGVSIGSYVGIIRGANKIIARVEKEYLDDKNEDPSSHEYLKDRFERRLEVRLIGNIYNGIFEFGIKHFPMIYNEVILLTQEEVGGILQRNSSSSKNTIPIGKSVSNNIPIRIAWDRLFNTHIGIFGNTGSGKSNTLTKLYTELFNTNMNFRDNSNFFFLDFNGEYMGKDVLYSDKKCLNLSTRSNNGDKLPLAPSAFWDIETLSILYSATEKTQRPFLEGAVKFFLDKDSNDITTGKIIDGLGLAFYNLFKQNNSKETLLLLNKSMEILGIDTKQPYYTEQGASIDVSWLNCLWHSNSATYYLGQVYINDVSNDTIKAKRAELKKLLSINEIVTKIKGLSMTKKLMIAVNCHMIYCLSYGRVQFDYVNPLIQRIETRSSFIEKTICIDNGNNSWGLVNVISLRNCNSDSKKMIPLLIVKQLYNEHKEKLMGQDKITSTVHLVIDEAHNILSEQSTREAEAWKDYRLEVFEEIIKEGRKFGFFITLASQRPYDISPTIVSQLHNFFIHRLVNEQDLKMIANTVTSLDSVSRAQIPALAPGQCIITGTSFEMPLLIQVDKLEEEASPASENADLVKLWTGCKN
jgi:hypothetical protein